MDRWISQNYRGSTTGTSHLFFTLSIRLLVLHDDLIIQVKLKFKIGDGGSRLLASATREPRSRDDGGCTIVGLGHACSRASREMVASRLRLRPRGSPRSQGDGGFPMVASATRVAALPGRLLAHDCWLRPRVSHASRTIVGSRLLASATREPRVQGVEPKGMRRRVLVSPTVRSRRSPHKFKFQTLISHCILLKLAVCPSHETR